MLSWLLIDSSSGDVTAVREKLLPVEFKRQLLRQAGKTGQLLVFTPGARSFGDALTASKALSRRLKSRSCATPFKGAVIGFSMAIQQIKLLPPNAVWPTKAYFKGQEDRIQIGKLSYRNFLDQLQMMRDSGELDSVFHFAQSAGTMLMQQSAAIKTTQKLSIDHTVVSGSPLGSNSFNKSGKSVGIVKASKGVTVYWAEDDAVILYAEKRLGPSIGTRGPTDPKFKPSYSNVVSKTCQFVDCSEVNESWGDNCNHNAYEEVSTIYEDILASMQGLPTPKRTPIRGSNGLGFRLAD